MESGQTDLTRLAHGFYWTEGVRGLGWAIDAIPTLKNGSTIGIPSPPAILLPSGSIIKPDIRDAERLQGFAADWTKPAEEASRATSRWSLVGNAVSVPVARWLGERISRPGEYSRERDRPLKADRNWPKAARSDGRLRYAVSISTAPIVRSRLPLREFLEHPGTPLSHKATAGFLKRARSSSLRFPTGFLDAVASHMLRMSSPTLPLAAE
jgi:DNA (cytosine-5)-methyltransferase 1